MQPDALNLAIALELGWKAVGSRVHSPACQRDEEHCSGKPPDFINDPSMSFLLLERLAEEGDGPVLDFEFGWQACGRKNNWAYTERHAEPGPAIAEYYARAKGIYVDDKA